MAYLLQKDRFIIDSNNFTMALLQKIKTRITSRKVIFSILAILMIVILSMFVVHELTFLGEGLNSALTAGTANMATEKFDIKGFEALKLQKP